MRSPRGLRQAEQWRRPSRSQRAFFEAFLGLINAGVLKREIDGAVLHGAFFLGPQSFYRALHEMTPDERARIPMTAVS